MKITDMIYNIGVTDKIIDLFEGQYPVPDGMTYNSYAIMDEKIAVMDTVDANFTEEWLDNLETVLGNKAPDYLIIQHMEPDHSANIDIFMKKYPAATIVASAKSFAMMKNFFGTDYAGRNLVVGEGDSLLLGTHILNFITAPMVHWPEVIMTYDATDRILFSADAFGRFGAIDTLDDWTHEGRRYYMGIVAKYGPQVQAVLKKIANLDIQKICSLHGPVINTYIPYFLDLYQTWSSYQPEASGIVVAYTSIYGNTKKAAELLVQKLQEFGCDEVVTYDLARCELSEAVADAFRYDRLILASPTYNGDVFPFMRIFIDHLKERNFRNRKVAFMENGSRAPPAAKVMQGMLEKSQNLTYADTTVKILSAVNEEALLQIENLAKEMCRG